MNRILSCVCLVGVMVLWSCADAPDDSQEAGRSALIIVDMQYDFLPGGALPTEDGDQILELINSLQSEFDLVVATQDWHPADHGSFASGHQGCSPGEIVDLHGIDQVLWPDHAVQGTHGAELAAELDRSRIARVFQKGTNPEVDSYSGFFDNGQRGDTGLAAYLESEGVTEVSVVGLALDYCVKYTALDSRRMGFDTTLIVDASRAVNLSPTDGSDAVEMMMGEGIQIVESGTIFKGSAQ